MRLTRLQAQGVSPSITGLFSASHFEKVPFNRCTLGSPNSLRSQNALGEDSIPTLSYTTTISLFLILSFLMFYSIVSTYGTIYDSCVPFWEKSSKSKKTEPGIRRLMWLSLGFDVAVGYDAFNKLTLSGSSFINYSSS